MKTDLYFHERIQKFTFEHAQTSQPWAFISTAEQAYIDKFCSIFTHEIANKGIRLRAETVQEMWSKFVQNGYKSKKEL